MLEFQTPEAPPEVTVVQQQLPQLLPDRIGFIGGGQMGEALMKAFLSAGVCTPSGMIASLRNSDRRAGLASLGVQTVGDAIFDNGAAEVAASSDIIFLAVRPTDLDAILQVLAPYVQPRHLIISIAAGVRLAGLEARLPEATRVVRVMPNAPCVIRQAATAFVLGTHAVERDASKVVMLMSSVGLATPVEERMMDAITGLSGAGPAYVFLMLEALADGAVSAGVPREQALALATQTVIGSARLVFEASGDGSITHPALLKDRVTSPLSCSVAGLVELETHGVRGAFIQAVRSAAKRSEELG